MPMSNYPFGVSSFGMPVVPGTRRPSTGNVFFVCNATNKNGSDGNPGTSPLQPLATVAKALTLCTASNDDVIFVMAGHAENITAAASIACSVAGVSIIGLGMGRLRPTFTWTTINSATITISGANVTWENCVFIGTGVASVVTMFAVTGDDCTFVGCEFDHANATNQAALGITITGTDRFKFVNNRVHGTANAGTTNFIQIVGSASKQKDYEFIGNSFEGNYTTTLGAINNITTAMVNLLVRDNVFVNGTASATKCIVTLTGSTGIVMRNTFGIGSGAAPISMDAGWWAGNWTAAAVATNSALI
jgi:hypothetical protein